MEEDGVLTVLDVNLTLPGNSQFSLDVSFNRQIITAKTKVPVSRLRHRDFYFYLRNIAGNILEQSE